MGGFSMQFLAVHRGRSGLRLGAAAAALATAAAVTVVATPASADLPDWVVIGNGTVQLGVNKEGHLNVPAGIPSAQGTSAVGLRFLPTNNEATAPGCLCEGWGAADATSTDSGWASVDNGGVSGNLTVESFTATASSAVSVVNIANRLRVTHDYHPSPATPNLYEVTVTIQNIGAATVAPRYRRVMDWDVEPTAFDEFSTIGGTAGAANVAFASDDGFANADALSGPSQINFTGDAVDNGPADHGALFDFTFDNLAPGASKTFKTYYGGAATEASADAALGAVGAEVYSYGQPSTADGPTLGTPNTFIFAFEGVGGTPVVPAVQFSSATYSVGEAGPTATIGVELTAAADSDVTVSYASSDGTATAGSDYTATSGTLTIPKGSTTGSFTVPITQDSLDEPDETVNLALSAPTGAVLGSPSSAVLTIVDDDVAPPAAHTTTTTYGGGTTVQYSDPLAVSGTLTDTTADPDAPVPGKSLSFTLGSQSASATTNASGVAASSITVGQAPGPYTMATAFAGDTAFLASSDSDAVTVAKEDCTLSYTGSTLVSAGGSTTLSAAMGEPDATLGDRSGKTVDFAVTDASMTTTHYTATTNASGVASTTQSLPAGAYAVVASFAGDAYYLPCAAAEELVTVEAAAPAGKVTGGGFVVADGRTSFGFNAMSDESGLRGQLQVRAPGKHRFHGNAVTALSVSGTTATWSGAGRWDGVSGYTFTVTVQDNRNGGSRKASTADWISISVRNAAGSLVWSTAGYLKGGNITVH